ncbi:MAG: Asp23/Gls24 family envelope stress response protein [Clostridiales bacterium]
MNEINDNLNNEDTLEGTQTGAVKIADEVVATIAGLAASEIEGIAGMSGGVVGGIADLLGRKNLTKGVKVEVGEKEANIDIFIVVEFGVTIPEVAKNVQMGVKNAVETMTGLSVASVNVHIQGVTFPQGHPAVKEETEE